MKRLLIATSNKGKLREYETIFKDLLPGVMLLSLIDFRVADAPEETGDTFKENASIKALFYYNRIRIPTLADDGGIEIDWLGGEPGVKSRRWPGHEATDEELIDMTLTKLRGVPFKKRGATLKAVIAFVPRENTVFSFEADWRGFIIEERKQNVTIQEGYPYRSLFFIPETGTILGELSFEQEVRIGHRRKAIEKALPVFSREL